MLAAPRLAYPPPGADGFCTALDLFYEDVDYRLRSLLLHALLPFPYLLIMGMIRCPMHTAKQPSPVYHSGI